ncbi:MAG: hypothetical protein COV48_12000, partial [Elusimicrobia bacterium CG11_big_fil_rev_8_21_14_0_20_64_6]
KTIVSAIDPFEIKFYLSIATTALGGARDVFFANSDSQLSLVIDSTFTVTEPSGAFTDPVEPIIYSTGIASMLGTASFTPVSGQTSLTNTDIRITCTANCPAGASAGFQWSEAFGSYVDPGLFGQQWLSVTGAPSPWSYSGWPNDNAAQPDNIAVQLEVRGRTTDGGVGLPAAPAIVYVVDKAAPSVSITNPIGGSVKKSQLSVNANATDLGSMATNLDI